ncbi:BTB/POZ domain-containing protein 3-like isoform X2 [Paramacrobiotus metropolitanus]|uniref:BTB/POZ domain-containing protein 3-like isoform X2 n=1 Tax=Paramacrobiotus metropolitanus TaxID=2943436 RepID=UPI0024458CE9|nr:BTB/POZ domain-containing protein 3-like isoform X2 [Paramacrobiotus metropolitanus]
MATKNPASSIVREQGKPAAGIVSCIQKSLASGEMSDVRFAVGRQFGTAKIFAAHKYILSIRSAVFRTMFHGSLPEKCDEAIDIPDFIPEAFANMLSYVYTDSLENLSLENVFPTLNCADKYDLPELVQTCTDFITSRLTEDDILATLEQVGCLQAMHWQADDVTTKCWQLIDSKTGAVLHSDQFTDIAPRTLQGLLQRSSLSADEEYDIYLAVERWAAAACQRADMEASAANRRQVLGDALFLIRFPLLSSAQLTSGPIKDGLLNDAEVLSVLMCQTGGAQSALPFSTERRRDALMRAGFKVGEEVFAQSPAGYWYYPAKIKGYRAAHLLLTWCYNGEEGTAMRCDVMRAAAVLTKGQGLHALVEKGYYRHAVYDKKMPGGKHCVLFNRKEVVVRFEELMLATDAEYVLATRQMSTAKPIGSWG